MKLQKTTIKNNFISTVWKTSSFKSIMSATAIKCHEFMRTIICYFTKMMNLFFGSKISSNLFLNYKPMLKNFIIMKGY